jgi:hypothetical protein
MERTAEIDRSLTEIPSLQTLSGPGTALISLRARVPLGRSHLAGANTQEPTANAVGEETPPLAHQTGDDELFTRLAAAVGTGHPTAQRLEGTLDEGMELDRNTSDRLGLARVLRQCRLAHVNQDPRQAQPLFEEAYRLAVQSDYRVVASWALDGLASCLSSSIATPSFSSPSLGGDDAN